MNKLTNHVTIFEVGPRDGLQNEKSFIPTNQKIDLINLLSETGLSRIEATSFVSPKWVPQMADATEVMQGIARNPAVRYAALTPNLKGYRAAKESGADEVAIFAAASEAFSQKNINCSIAESLDRFKELITAAKSNGMPVRGYVSCVVGCPYKEDVQPAKVAEVVSALLHMGCYEVSLGDTIGAGTPESIAAMLDAVMAVTSPQNLAGHYHDTNGRALENISVSLDKGLRVFDTAVGGLGGCPYAPGAKGNVSTSAVIAKLHSSGYETGVDLEKLRTSEKFVESFK